MALVAGTVVVNPTTEAVTGSGLARSRFDQDLLANPLPALPTVGMTTGVYSSARPATQVDVDQMQAARVSILNGMASKANASAVADAAQVNNRVVGTNDLFALTAGGWSFLAFGSGNGSIGTIEETGHPGLVSLTSSATGAASSGGSLTAGALVLESGYELGIIFKTPAAATTGVVNLFAAMGFFNGSAAYTMLSAQRVAISYDGSFSTTASVNDGTTTTASLGTLSASTWYQAHIVVNSASVNFYVYSNTGALVSSALITAAIPVSVVSARVAAGTAGADGAFLSANTMYVDRVTLVSPNITTRVIP
jgi:hypothetical protein